ncbi:MAG: hypothetical protein QMC62_05700 [Alteromonadaceae bacterium]
MKILDVFIVSILLLISMNVISSEAKKMDISDIISKEEFSLYKNVGDFIDHSPKVTIVVNPEPEDIAEYGTDVVKSLTGSDCDRDGVMDDNARCNAVYYKLWMKYER